MKFSTHPLSPDLAGRRDLQVAPVDLELAARLRASLVPMLEQGNRLADVFYDELFTRKPQLRPMFTNNLEGTKTKLLQTLEWIVNNLDRPAEVRAQARSLGKKHEGYGVTPEHYVVARDTLVFAMGKVAGDRWTRDLEADWTLSFDLLAAMMTGQTSIRRGDKTSTRL